MPLTTVFEFQHVYKGLCYQKLAGFGNTCSNISMRSEDGGLFPRNPGCEDPGFSDCPKVDAVLRSVGGIEMRL